MPSSVEGHSRHWNSQANECPSCAGVLSLGGPPGDRPCNVESNPRWESESGFNDLPRRPFCNVSGESFCNRPRLRQERLSLDCGLLSTVQLAARRKKGRRLSPLPCAGSWIRSSARSDRRNGTRLASCVSPRSADLGGHLKPAINGQSKPAIKQRRPKTRKFYFEPSSVRKSVCTLVRQLRGPHLRTCA